MNKRITIAIDGYSGTGKSSTAKAVARALDYTYIDSGAMYRAVTLYLLDNQIDLSLESRVVASLSHIHLAFDNEQMLLNGKRVNDEIRSMRVNEAVSRVAAIRQVREAMVIQQQEMGRQKGVVMDGRDIGTVVFPDAELKIFMVAGTGIRALRRQKELAEKGIHEELSLIQANLEERDKIDTTREVSPLIKARGAVELDTSDLNFDDQVAKIVNLAKSMMHES